MIGEQFDHGDEICGAVVNVRARQEKIALWTKDATNEAAQVANESTCTQRVPFLFSLHYLQTPPTQTNTLHTSSYSLLCLVKVADIF